MILDSPTSLLHQGSPASWIFATKSVLKSPGEFLEISLRGLMVKISSTDQPNAFHTFTGIEFIWVK